MKTVCIVVGHSAQDGGAFNENKQIGEYEYNNPLATAIAMRLHAREVRPIIMYRDTYGQLASDINKTDADYCISLHCNASSNFDVKGQETLHWHTSKRSQQLAKHIQKNVFHLMNERDRGLKPIDQGERGWPLLKGTKMPAVIIEPFFISNDQSLTTGLALRDQLANAIAGAVIDNIIEEQKSV
ncbi:N-acetylmuramoyl-L-alanine amidase [Vibrio marisflavi]|uniref:N-acetylmuramoyl-L-alanine amidase n=1 Tax=Vibrio marisflavi CECT 7928 TaxID=634439 RepID=A0ABN8E9D7_9VIBR|nr:N-acetylmuramoyl-L-alanine amidase [Vibrio marisflavi]CAH0543034.1 N-acetylmuramoyl-L-alanine amidase LytC [Vibrio marisflavi CECT 7928]